MFWLDGTLHATSRLPFDVADRGLLLGDGVFDTSLVLGGKMVWREAHVARLLEAATTLGFALDPARVAAGINAVSTARSASRRRAAPARAASRRRPSRSPRCS
jgi:branched-chain amino acid aminotransferase